MIDPTLLINRLMLEYNGETHTHLANSNEVELFVAVFLSPQNSDAQVNKVVAKLFMKYKTFADYAKASTPALMKDLNSLNFYKTKAKHIKEASRMISNRFDGHIPNKMQDLLLLPGVGRKIANIILNELYNINEGIAVDTHCITVSNRLGLAKSKKQEIVEKNLMKKIPKAYWGKVSNLFIALGKDKCKARKKECERCVLNDICPSSTV
ncbi:MAG: endonuclease III domain-containing protein [Candidatus Micrarchaeia archaeon]